MNEYIIQWYSRSIFNFQPSEIKQLFRKIETKSKQLITINLHQEFNNICLNENLLPIYTNIYIGYIYIYRKECNVNQLIGELVIKWTSRWKYKLIWLLSNPLPCFKKKLPEQRRQYSLAISQVNIRNRPNIQTIQSMEITQPTGRMHISLIDSI